MTTESRPNLNDDVLIRIFAYMSVIERNKCRSACRHWRWVIDQLRPISLSLIYVDGLTWVDDDRYELYKKFSHAIQMADFDSISKLLHFSIHSKLAELNLFLLFDSTRPVTSSLNLSHLTCLKQITITGSSVQFNPKDVQLPSVQRLDYPVVSDELLELFPNVVDLACNRYQSICRTYPKLRSLNIRENFNYNQFLNTPRAQSRIWAPNITHLTCPSNHIILFDVTTPDLVQLTIRCASSKSGFREEWSTRLREICAQSVKFEFQLDLIVSTEKDLMNVYQMTRQVADFVFAPNRLLRIWYLGKVYDLHQFINKCHQYCLFRSHFGPMFRIDLNSTWAQQVARGNFSDLVCLVALRKITGKVDGYNLMCFERLVDQLPNLSALKLSGDLTEDLFKRVQPRLIQVTHLKWQPDSRQPFDARSLLDLICLENLELNNVHIKNSECLEYVARHFNAFVEMKLKSVTTNRCPFEIARKMIERAKRNKQVFYTFDLRNLGDFDDREIESKFNQQFEPSQHNFCSNLFGNNGFQKCQNVQKFCNYSEESD